MSMKAWAKIDRFYPILALISVALLVLVILTFKNIFSSILTAYEPKEVSEDSTLRIDKERLDNAYKAVFNKEIIPLEISQ
jgi:hypothetical protein